MATATKDEKFSVNVEFQQGQTLLFHDPSVLPLVPGQQFRVKLEGRRNKMKDGEPERDEAGKRITEACEMEKIGLVRQTVAGIALELGHTPELEQLHDGQTRIWDLRPWDPD